MSKVNVYSNDKDELDRLLNNVQLVELEPQARMMETIIIVV